MGDDIPTIRCVIRGFIGARQVLEDEFTVQSRREAWEHVGAYFDGYAPWSDCDRYTVDTYLVY